MSQIYNTTHLFDGLTFEEAIQVYWRVIEEGEKFAGDHNGKKAQTLDFLGFVIEKKEPYSPYLLKRLKLYPQTQSEWDLIAAINLDDPSGFVAAGFGYVLGVELLKLIPEVASYEVTVRDVNKVGGESDWKRFSLTAILYQLPPEF